MAESEAQKEHGSADNQKSRTPSADSVFGSPEADICCSSWAQSTWRILKRIYLDLLLLNSNLASK